MEAMRANVPHLGELVRPQARSENKASHALSMATVRRDDVVRWEVSCRCVRMAWCAVRHDVHPYRMLWVAVPSRRDYFCPRVERQ